MPRTSPKAAVPSRCRGRNECADNPANSARPRSSGKVEIARPRAELRQGQRMVGPPQWRAEDGIGNGAPSRDQGRHQPPIRRGSASESLRRPTDRAHQQRRGAVIEWVGDSGRRLDPGETVLREWHAAEEREERGERMDGRTDVVNDARQR
jgi:hypothetical protein